MSEEGHYLHEEDGTRDTDFIPQYGTIPLGYIRRIPQTKRHLSAKEVCVRVTFVLDSLTDKQSLGFFHKYSFDHAKSSQPSVP
ncbi:MAG: hypothetical protein K0R47_346 [Brevibacillus sp.]|nr:hypothetical protein [Brevibacillus sp.]